jgi:hypothetical protein
MTALLAYLRHHPWLAPCLMITAIGVRTVATSRFGHLLFWAGILSCVGGLLMALTGHLGHRQVQARRTQKLKDSLGIGDVQ